MNNECKTQLKQVGSLYRFLQVTDSFLADLSSVDNNGATAWDYARGRQLHYCMLIIASYIRQRAKERGEEVDMGTLANMTFAGKYCYSDCIRKTPKTHLAQYQHFT